MSQYGDDPPEEQPSYEASLHNFEPSTIEYFISILHRIMYIKTLVSAPSDSPRSSTWPVPPPTPPSSPVIPPLHLENMAAHHCPGERIVPTFFRPWDGFEASQDERLESIHSHLPSHTTVLPPRVCLSESQSLLVSDFKNAYSGFVPAQVFFHYTVEAPVIHITNVLNNLPGVKPFNPLGAVCFQPNIDTINASIPRPGWNIQERESRDVALNPNQSCVYRSDENGQPTSTPICLNQYHSPDELSWTDINESLGWLGERQKPFTIDDFVLLREAEDGTHWTSAQKKTLSALTHVYNVLIQSGLSFGLVTTGETIVFLTLDWDSPGTLFFKLMHPDVYKTTFEHGCYNANSAAAAQCLSFYLLALSEVFQQESAPVVTKTRGWYSTYPFTRVCESIIVVGEVDYEGVAAYHHTTHMAPLPPRPPPAPTYPLSVRLAFAKEPAPRPPNEVVSTDPRPVSPILNLRWPKEKKSGYSSWSHSTTINVRSFQSTESHSEILLPPIAKSNADWFECTPATHQSVLPPITLCSAGVDADFFVKLPPILSPWIRYPPDKISHIEAMQALSPISITGGIGMENTLGGQGRLPTLLPKPAFSPPQAAVYADEGKARRLGVNIQPRPEGSSLAGGHLSPPLSQDQQPNRADTPSGGRSGYNKTQDVNVDDQSENDDDDDKKNKKKKYKKSAPPPRREYLPAGALLKLVEGSDKKAIRCRRTNPQVQYCTHLCLLGLVEGQPVDPLCPNFMSHCRTDENPEPTELKHLITHSEFLDVVIENIHRGVEKKAERIHENVFKMQLSGYNYAFICKRFADLHKVNMDHEVAVYGKLKPLQGKCIPVLVGHVSLQRHVRKECQPKFNHYTLMSSAGVPLMNGPQIDADQHKLAGDTEEAIRAFHMHGVLYRPTLQELFYNAVWKDVMIVGLGKANIMQGSSESPDETNTIGPKRAHKDDTSFAEGRPNKKQRSERGSSTPPAEEQGMTISKMAQLYSQGLSNPVLRDIYSVRRLFNTSNSEDAN